MNVTVVPASAVGAAALCDAFNASFADYLIGPPDLPQANWPHFLQRQGVDLDLSGAALDAQRHVQAFVLVCPLAACTRIAVMGALPAARGSGLARRLLDMAVEEARARGSRWVELEVFARNDRALALYRSRGFVDVAELHGHFREPGPAPDVAALPPPRAVELPQAIRWLARQPQESVPFQMSALCVAATRPPLFAWQQAGAQLVFALREPADAVVISLVDPMPQQAGARSMLRHLAARHAGLRLSVPQLQRADLGGHAFDAEGWEREPMHQLLMRLPLQG